MARRLLKFLGREKRRYVLPVGPGGTKGLVELERKCQDTRQEIQVLSERQEIFKSPLQCRANERYHDQIFEEIKELEQKKSAEALRMVWKR